MHKSQHGFIRTIMDDELIVVYTFHDNQRATIDAWVEYLMKRSQEWDTRRPFLILYDLREIFLTPYMRRKANEISAIRQLDLVGASALVLSDSLMARIMIRFIKRDMRKPKYHSTFDVFLDYEQAVTWLRNQRAVLSQHLIDREATTL